MKPITRQEAIKLWSDIIKYSEAQYELGAQGNSGEFSDDKEELRLNRDVVKTQETLIYTFAAITGWQPVWYHFTINMNMWRWRLFSEEELVSEHLKS